jgi:hypothetical protein
LIIAGDKDIRILPDAAPAAPVVVVFVFAHPPDFALEEQVFVNDTNTKLGGQFHEAVELDDAVVGVRVDSVTHGRRCDRS